MFDHLALQVANPSASAVFYARIFAPLGIAVGMRVERPEGDVVGMSGPDGFPHLWFGPLIDHGHRTVHLALAAPSRDAVDEVHRAALITGTEILHDPRPAGSAAHRRQSIQDARLIVL